MTDRPWSASSLPRDLPPLWEVDLAPVAITLDDDPAARPGLILIVAGGFVLACDVVGRPSAEPSKVAETLAQAIRTTIMTTSRRPTLVHIRHFAVAAALGDLLGADGIIVRKSTRLPDLDAVLASFRQNVLGGPPEDTGRLRASRPETWAAWGLPPEQIARLFAAAASFYRAAPWACITNEDVLRAKVKGGGSWSASVMGMAGEVFGLALFARHKDLLALLHGDPDRPEEAPNSWEGSILSFSFDHRDELPPRMRKEVRRAGWEVAGPAAYPSLIAMNTPGGGLAEREIEDMIVVLEAVPAFVSVHEPMLYGREPARYPIRWTGGGGVRIVFEGAPDRLG